MWKLIHDKNIKESQGTMSKGQMILPNIHINNSKYPYSIQEAIHFSTISYISHISQVYADKRKQQK